MVLGTLWCSIKHIEAPYLFDWEQGIALHPMRGNRASSLREGENSFFFSSCGGAWAATASRTPALGSRRHVRGLGGRGEPALPGGGEQAPRGGGLREGAPPAPLVGVGMGLGAAGDGD